MSATAQMPSLQPHASAHRSTADTAKLCLGALGVVFGDIGTSPLYAIRECFGEGAHIRTTPDQANIFGVMSLVFWSLMLVVAIKYITFVMRADNKGEGGVLALLALVAPSRDSRTKPAFWARALVMIGLFGAALLLADGMITPAISVLSAVEGLEVLTPNLKDFILPITTLILIGLFMVQRYGTTRIAVFFGPIMVTWFVMIFMMGLPWLIKHPEILQSINPWYAYQQVMAHPKNAFVLLGYIVLCITGAEALYADMGHFGRGPIRFSWFTLVAPALLMNYFGQCALLLDNPALLQSDHSNLFFNLAPRQFLIPVLIVSTLAAVIASQAMISGAFSIAQQAVHLGYSPRLAIIHTSSKVAGQIFVPEINALLAVSCVALVFGFQNSSNLAAAYGIAVVGTMLITSLLFFAVLVKRWNWPMWKAGALLALFLAFDVPFLASNLVKIRHGGWFPIAVAAALIVVMTTWHRGRRVMEEKMQAVQLPLPLFIKDSTVVKPHRVDGTAVFMCSFPQVVPAALLHHFKHNKVLHKQIVLLTVSMMPTPHVEEDDRLTINDAGEGFFTVIVRCGFMDQPDIPEAMIECAKHGIAADPMNTSYYLGRTTLLPTGGGRMFKWRKRLYAALFHNERTATAYFNLPPNRVVEMGRQLEL